MNEWQKTVKKKKEKTKELIFFFSLERLQIRVSIRRQYETKKRTRKEKILSLKTLHKTDFHRIKINRQREKAMLTEEPYGMHTNPYTISIYWY